MFGVEVTGESWVLRIKCGKLGFGYETGKVMHICETGLKLAAKNWGGRIFLYSIRLVTCCSSEAHIRWASDAETARNSKHVKLFLDFCTFALIVSKDLFIDCFLQKWICWVSNKYVKLKFLILVYFNQVQVFTKRVLMGTKAASFGVFFL